MIEELRTLIDDLARERQLLRERHASRDELESNRARLVRAQLALSYALIERYGRRAA